MVGEESLSQRFALLTLLQGSVTEGLNPLGAGKPLDFCHWETERHTQTRCLLPYISVHHLPGSVKITSVHLNRPLQNCGAGAGALNLQKQGMFWKLLR